MKGVFCTKEVTEGIDGDARSVLARLERIMEGCPVFCMDQIHSDIIVLAEDLDQGSDTPGGRHRLHECGKRALRAHRGLRPRARLGRGHGCHRRHPRRVAGACLGDRGKDRPGHALPGRPGHQGRHRACHRAVLLRGEGRRGGGPRGRARAFRPGCPVRGPLEGGLFPALNAGLDESAVEVKRLCTSCHPGRFNSYRRQGALAGRNISVIGGKSWLLPGLQAG
jgi:hypothetical protein